MNELLFTFDLKIFIECLLYIRHCCRSEKNKAKISVLTALTFYWGMGTKRIHKTGGCQKCSEEQSREKQWGVTGCNFRYNGGPWQPIGWDSFFIRMNWGVELWGFPGLRAFETDKLRAKAPRKGPPGHTEGMHSLQHDLLGTVTSVATLSGQRSGARL